MPDFQHNTRGFEPLNGSEITKACAAALFQALSKQSELSLHLAYAVVSWRVTCDLTLASSPMDPGTETHYDISGTRTQHERQSDGTEGSPVPVSSAPMKVHVDTSTVVEEPDRIREKLLGEIPRDPSSSHSNVAVAPTRAGVEAHPESFRNTAETPAQEVSRLRNRLREMKEASPGTRPTR